MEQREFITAVICGLQRVKQISKLVAHYAKRKGFRNTGLEDFGHIHHDIHSECFHLGRVIRDAWENICKGLFLSTCLTVFDWC